MVALPPRLALALLALCACSQPGRSAAGDPSLFGSGEAASAEEQYTPVEPPPNGRALSRLVRSSEPRPEDALLRLPSAMQLAVAETVNAERLGRVQREGDRRVIVLTPLPCRIAEQEAAPSAATDREGCRIANQTAFASRSQQVWTLPAGRYTVRVVNREVDWPVGLWLRSDKGNAVAAEGGGGRGETIEVEVDLVPGNYLVSLPLLPTPDYLWQVQKAPR